MDAQLVIVGDGPYRARMEAELAGADAVFAGFRHGAELAAIYASSDVFVFPSTTDTLGQVVMEAQCSGLPVIVTDQGGPKEVVDDGVTGRIIGCDQGAASIDAWSREIVATLTDDEMRARFGEAGRLKMHGASIERSFRDFWRVHEEVARVA